MTDTPRSRRKARNRAAILDAAAGLIIAKGLENVSLRDIAKKADYSPAGLYKYFSGKEAIIRAVQRRENQKLLALLDAVPPDLNPLQRLVKLCMLYIEFSLGNQAYLTLVNNLPSERKSKQQPVPDDSPYAIFYKAVQAWSQSEHIQMHADFGPEEITYSLWAQIHGMATLQLNQLRYFEADFESINRRSIRIYLKGIQKWDH
jgi:AcrR family transcriptional regulator